MDDGVGHTITQRHSGGGVSTYHLLERLRQGSEGPTWKARRHGPAGGQDLVAVKAISDYWLRVKEGESKLSEKELRERYTIVVEQHRLVRRVRLPGVAVADDVFCAEESWFGEIVTGGRRLLAGRVRPIAVTGWVEGRTLPKWNESQEYARNRVSVLRPVAEAIDELNRKEVVVRDVKPENVVVDANGHAVYVDFGLVMLLSDPKRATGATGTEGYHDAFQVRSDRYSFAGLLLHQLTNNHPIPRRAERQARLRLTEQAYPPALVDLLSNALSYPVVRPAMNATDMLKEVSQLLAGMRDQTRLVARGRTRPRPDDVRTA